MYQPYSSMFRHAVHAWFAIIVLLIAFWLTELTTARAAGLTFSLVTISGTNLVVSGSGGAADATYYLMASTNLALSPVALWNRISTNAFSTDGQFTNNIPIAPSVPQEFIIIATTLPVTVISGLTANDKTYDGTTTATLGSNNVVLDGVLPADAANVRLSTNGYTAAFASAGTNNNITVSVSGLTLTGSAATNYTLTQPSLLASISPAPVTISSGISATNKPYDGTTTATITSNSVVLSGVLAGDVGNVRLSTNGYTANFASAGVGNAIGVTVSGLSLTGSAAGNYSLSQPTGLSANITGKGVTINSGISANNKVYDGTTAATITSNAVVLSGVLAGDVGNVRLSTNGYTANFTSANVGTNIAVTVSGLSLTGSAAGNYTVSPPAGLTANITAPVPVPGLVAAYSFDEGSGTTISDASGNGNNGTISGTTWTTSGKYGKALVFNGTSTLLNINNSATLQLSSAMTLEAWVNPSTVSNVWRDVIYKGDDNYYLEGTSGNGRVPAMGGTFGTSDVVLYGTGPLSASTWTHLAATYDGATTRLYVNGVQAASQAQTGAIKNSTNPLQIGGDSIYGQFFQGTIDEVRVYNVALTAAQIQNDMNTPVGDIPTAPGNLAATVISTNHVNLSWTASTGDLGVAGYFVERSQGAGSTNFIQIGATSSTSYDDTNLVLITNYNYRVRATDASGDLGPYSSVVLVFTGLSISPRVTVLTSTQTQQFTANGSNLTWSVDGVVGGSASSGTITGTGLYSPPGSAGTHSVAATTSDLSESASATVYVTADPGTFTFHNDGLRTGQNLNETVLTPANVNTTNFEKLFSYPLDGLSLASPLYVANVNIPGHGFHNVVYVATEHDSVYAFDADGLSNTPLWQVSFINPAAGVTPVPAADTGETGDIPNEIGITGTPVIDPVSGTIYVVAKTKEVSGNTTSYVQRLHALDITTGAEKFGGPVVIQASVAGTGPGSQGGQVPFGPLLENQRAALLLTNGVVYFGFSSHGDNPPYYGWLLGYNASTLQRVFVHNSAPNVGKAGIWMDGDGPAVDASGNIYFITGDGVLDANTGGVDYGDCFMKVSPSGTVLDYFSPSVQTTLDASNLDLGSGGGLLLPDQPGTFPHEMVSAGKNGTIYLVNRDNMGHYNHTSDPDIQSLVNVFTNNLGQEGGNFSSPVYFNSKVYFSPVQTTVQAFSLTNGLLSAKPTSQSSEVYAQRGGTMAISANGNTNGILWTLQSNGTTVPGTLHAYDATDLGKELYNSDQAGLRDTLDIWWKFTTPVVANGKVFVVSTGQLTAYGLLPNPGVP